MTQEKKVQTAAVMDVTGVERSAQDAVRAARQMAEGITREGEKAGKGLEAMGAGAEKAERTVDAKTKSISDRIRRLTQQSQRELAALAAGSAGGAGSAAAVEYEASLRGADVAKLQSALDGLRVYEGALSRISAAERELASQAAFSKKAAEAAQLVRATDYVNWWTSALAKADAAEKELADRSAFEKKAADAAKLVQAADYVNWWSGALDKAEKNERELAATDAFNKKAADAAQLVRAGEYVNWWTAQLDQMEATERRVAAGKNFLSGVSAQVNALGKTRADLLELKAAELGVTAQAAPMIAAIRAADGQLLGLGKNAKITAATLRTVPAQFTDIVVSLQAGQNPLQVLLQQGGQLKDQFGGIGPAAQALGGYILGLVNPYTLAAGAVGALAISYLAANSGISAATRVLIESGNQAGITAGQLQDAAEAIAALGGDTTSRAAELLADLAKSGDLGAAGLSRYAAAALEFERAGGQAADKTVEAFNELGKSPVTAALKLNNATNFLTRSIFEQIRALEEQGRTAEAAKVAADAYADAIEGRTPAMAASLNIVQRAWRGVAEEAKSALDSYLSIFRTATTQDQLTEIRKQIAELEAAGQQSYLIGPSISDLRDRERNLQESLRLDQKSAERDRARKQQVDAAAEIAKIETETMSRQQKMQQELNRFSRSADTAGIDPERRARLEAAIRAKYTEKPTGDRGLARAQLAEQLQDIRAGEQERQTVYRQSEAIIEAQRQAGLLSEADYYEARRAFARLDADSRIGALQEEIETMQRFRGTATEEARVRRDISVAEQKINQARAESAGKDLILRTQQTAAIEAQSRAMFELEAAADAELAALQRRLGIQVRQTGTGNRRAGEEAELEQVSADFTRRQLQLESEYRNGRLRGREDQYRKELTLLITEEGRQLQVIEEFQRKKREADANYRNGLSSGIENVIDDTFQTANRTARLTEDAFKGLGDALTEVFTKGKTSWSSLEQTILQGITRIIVEQQLIRPIAQFLAGGSGGFIDFAGSILGKLLGGATGGSGMPDGVPTRGGRAAGGPVERGGLYEINETRRGPGEVLNVGGRQYLLALQGGYVKPVAASGAAAGRTLQQVNNFHVSGPIDRRTQQQLATQTGRAAQAAMMRNG